ncbi:hypothetical protein G6F43_007952 [Rhizopus delemar]|nr:hypothetical protein G6F43_007952 [Rhizopus delemar]
MNQEQERKVLKDQNGSKVRYRVLWTLKNEYLNGMALSIRASAKIRQKVSRPGTSGSDSKMVNKLYDMLLVDKVFVTTSSRANDAITSRDTNGKNAQLTLLNQVHGNTQGNKRGTLNSNQITHILQPLVTLEEREMLLDISKCQNTAGVEKLLTTWTREDWFRMHLYSNVWDKAFFDDDEFETKRSECLSQVMKVLKEIDGNTRLQRLDFILRDLNTNNDVMTAEEKPTLKGVKAVIK